MLVKWGKRSSYDSDQGSTDSDNKDAEMTLDEDKRIVMPCTSTYLAVGHDREHAWSQQATRSVPRRGLGARLGYHRVRIPESHISCNNVLRSI